MKIFKVFAIVCLFFFMIGCDDGVTRFVPVDETDDGTSEITDDSDTPDTTSDTTDSDDSDTTPDTTDSGTPDTTPDTPDTDSPDTDSPDTDSPDSEAPDSEVPDSEIPDSEVPDSEIPDSEVPDSEIPDSEVPDGDTDTDTDTGTPDYCSAVFNGDNSKIEVAHNDALNLDGDEWTIEAWIKQTGDATDEIPIVGKPGGSSKISYTYLLSNYYKKNMWTAAMKGSAYFNGTMSPDLSAEATGLTNSGDWTHIALVKTSKGIMSIKLPTITLYINGISKESKSINSSTGTISIATSTKALLIGSTGTKSFNGLIDSIKISDAAKYTGNFAPAKLSVDNDTIAFWDFSGNANESKSGMTSTPTNITYSEDCKK